MSDLPLSGIRVLSLEQAIALPFATRHLADMGAEVIRVESHTRTAPRTPAMNDHVRQKATITLDLTKPEAVQVCKELVAHCDVVCENFTPRVMSNFGLSFEHLRRVRPDIIMLSLCGYGQTGPWRNYPAFGPGIESAAGLAQLTGYPDRGPTRPGTITYADNITGLYAGFAIIAALAHRERTGEGQYIDVSMYETNICHIGEALIAYGLNGQLSRRQGNRDDFRAPHGVYPSRGADQWVTIAVENDDIWRLLCATMGHSEWATDERFRDQSARHAHQDELDALIAEWTATLDHYEITCRLQAIGIASAPVLTTKEILLDPHLRSRGLFSLVEHAKPIKGVLAHPHTGPLWKFSDAPALPVTEAHDIGQDSERVIRGLLDASDERWNELIECGAVGWPASGAGSGRRAEPASVEVLLARSTISAYDPNVADILGLPKADSGKETAKSADPEEGKR